MIDKKLMFPVIVFCPAFDEDLSDKVLFDIVSVDGLV